MQTRSYADYIRTAKQRHGDKFDDSSLAPQFVRYFESGERIEVAGDEGEGYVRRGRVGVTTGWKPAFLLMHRTSDHGSSDVLGERDEVARIIAR